MMITLEVDLRQSQRDIQYSDPKTETLDNAQMPEQNRVIPCPGLINYCALGDIRTGANT